MQLCCVSTLYARAFHTQKEKEFGAVSGGLADIFSDEKCANNLIVSQSKKKREVCTEEDDLCRESKIIFAAPSKGLFRYLVMRRRKAIFTVVVT